MRTNVEPLLQYLLFVLCGCAQLAHAQTVVVDFDSLNASGAAILGAPLHAYFASYGIQVTEGPSANLNVQQAPFWEPTSSAPNLLNTYGDSSTAYSGTTYTLTFATVQNSVSFYRAGVQPGSTMGLWSATAYSSTNQALSAVGEGNILSGTSPQQFALTGPGIDHITFYSNVNGFAGTYLSIDDLTLQGSGPASTLSVASSLPPGQAGQVYPPGGQTAQLVSGGTTPYDVSAVIGLGALALAIDPNTGNVTGQVPPTIAPGTYPITGSVTDAGTPPATMAVALTLTVNPANDVVTVTNSGASVGLWINGSASGVTWDHRLVGPTTSNPIDLGANVQPAPTAPSANEIVAFTDGHPPSLLFLSGGANNAWTNGFDDIPATFRAHQDVPITIWVVDASSHAYAKAIDDVLNAFVVAEDERIGFSITVGGFTDLAMSNPAAAAAFSTFNCRTPSSAASVRAQFPPAPNSINVYYFNRVVATVTSSSGPVTQDVYGCTMRPENNFIAISVTRAPTASLIHEIGHAMSLEHACTNDASGRCIGNLPGFNDENLMTYGASRKYFTEGQTFRMNFNSTSALSTVYRVPPAFFPDCQTLDAGLRCPALSRRIWPDGTLPAN